MNRVAAWKILPLSLFVIICVAGAHLAAAQQAADSTMPGMYSATPGSAGGTAAPAAPGIYSDAAALSRTSTEELAGQMGLANSNRADANSAKEKLKETKISRSAWMAGSTSLGVGSASAWVPGAAGFASRGTSSWVAGASSFGMQRQQDGIWRVLPGAGLSSDAAPQAGALASAPGLRHFSAGLTSKGTALLGRSFSSSLGSRQGAGSGFSSSVHGPYTPHRFTGAQNPFAPQAKTPGSGNRSSSTLHAPASGTMADPSMPAEPALDDTLRLNNQLNTNDLSH